MKVLLSGNEAIALGAWEAGVQYASAYPGTPSTEILENLARYPGVRAEWASNEKVALDNAIGASFGGGRTIAAMKHVGVNVAADSLMSVSYTGVEGGLVLVSADDPGALSSQNEQDSRQYARFGKFPCLEPSDSTEARRFVAAALELSELFQTPAMLRSTTRLSHSKSAVEAPVPDAREFVPLPPFEREAGINRTILPAVARQRHPQIEARLDDVAAWSAAEGFDRGINRIEWGDTSVGVITTGMAYQYVRELLGDRSILKLGISYPLPLDKIREFAANVDRLVVVEELDPFIEDQLKAAGIDVAHGKDVFPICGEFSLATVRAGAVAAGLLADGSVQADAVPMAVDIPERSAALCPGCPHRAFFFNIRRYKRKVVIAGDIGCYSMGALPPFTAVDMLISMGASVGMAHGFNRAGGEESAIAVIGDSTFFHSGMAPLASAVYNRSDITVVVLDNRITAMTGQQQHPGTGITLQGETGREIDIAAVATSLGVTFVEEVGAWNVDGVNRVVREAMAHDDGPAVVVVRGACVFTPYFHVQPKMRVDPDKCVACGMCFNVGCPAIIKSDEIYETSGKWKATIDSLLCTGCTVCTQVCPVGAIERTSE